MHRKIPFTLLLLLAILASMIPAAFVRAQGPVTTPTAEVQTGEVKDSQPEGEEGAPTGQVLTPPPGGILAASHTYTSTTAVAIPDASCPTYTTARITVTDSFLIGDLNVGLWIVHTYRSDLDMYLRGPDNTLVELYTDPDSGADNINALIDDASPNAADSNNHAAPPPYYPNWWYAEGNLADFNGKNAQGVWTLEICDDAGGDIGTITTWTLFFKSGLIIDPPAQSGSTCKGGDVVYNYTLINSTATTTSFSLAYTSTWPAYGPTTTPVLEPGESWPFQVTAHIPWVVNMGDQDTLTVGAYGAGDSAQATATTRAAMIQGYQDFANTPRPTRDHALVYYNGKLYKIGGYDGAAQAYLDIYDIATNTWTAGAAMPGARYWIDCEAIAGKIYCAGGYLASGQTTLYIYDIASNTWTTGAALAAYRYNYASATYNGLYYIIGGYAAGYSNATLVYNPATNVWTTLAPMSTARRYFHAGVIGNKIYVAGGYNGVSPYYLSSAEVYDIATNTWSPIAAMPTLWNRGGDAVKHDRYLFVFGGAANSTGASNPTVLIYDSVSNTWSYGPDMPHSIYGTEADGDGTNVWIVSGRLYAGGVYSYSPYTTLLVQCATSCTPVSGADFTWTPDPAWVTFPTSFAGTVTGGSPSIQWDWNWGDSTTGSGQNVDHTYATTGTYTVVMTATNCDGANVSVAAKPVSVVVQPTLAVDPDSLSAKHCNQDLSNQTLTLCNTGGAPLTWHMREYSPTLGWEPGTAWEIMTPIPAGRVFGPIVAAGPYVFAIGGTSDAAGTLAVSTTLRYDTRTNTWQTMAAMPAPLGMAFMDGATVNGKIYIPGSDAPVQDNNTYVYDVAADTWTIIPTNNGYVAGEMYGAVALGTNLYVLGGIVGGVGVPNVWVLDTVAGTWSPGVPMQKQRINMAAEAVGGKIYALGGVAYPGFAPDMTSEVFDGTSWSYVAPVPGGGGAYTRWSYMADGADPEHVWLAAGRRDTSWVVLNHAGTYNVLTDDWTTSPDYPILNQARVYLEGDVAAGYMYAMGGRDSAGAIIYDVSERLFTGYLDIPWLDENLLTGVIPGGTCADVTVSFDSTGMPDGNYFAGLLIESNDPVLPETTVPVTLAIGCPDIVVTPPSLEADQCPDTVTTQTLSICNNGVVSLDWGLEELSGTMILGRGDYPPMVAEVSDITDALLGSTTAAPEEILGIDAWGTGAVMPGAGRYRAGSALESCNRIWVIGGGAGGNGSPDVMYYDAAADAWTTRANIPNAGQNWQPVYIDGKIYVPGGYNGAHNNWLQIYDIAGNTWSAGANLPVARSPMAAAWSGQLYIFGGNPGPSNEVRRYDPATNTWSAPLAAMPTARSYGRAITAGDYIYVVGGAINGQAAFERYDPAADTWSTGPNMGGTGRGDVSLFHVGDYLYASGGISDYATWYGLTTVERYYLPDWPGGAWESMPAAPNAFGAAAYGCAAQSKMFSIGGQDGSGQRTTTNRWQDEGLDCGCFVPPVVDVPWLSENPISGAVPVGECQDVVVTFDSTGLTPGNYYAGLLISSDDPDTPEVTVPVTLTVKTLPDIAVTAPPLEADLCPSATATIDFTICNYGECLLDWTVTEVSGTQALRQPWSFTLPAMAATISPAAKAHAPAQGPRPVTIAGGLYPLATYQVLIVSPDSTMGDITLLLNTLAAYPDLVVTVWDNLAGNPTAADMAPYDVVLFGNDYTWESAGLDKALIGDALADYIDAGGTAIESEFVQSYDNWGFGGRYMTDGYSPFTPATTDYPGITDTMNIVEPTHPVMQGIGTITDYRYQQDPGLRTGATLLADWNLTGNHAVAVNDNVVALNILIFHSAGWSGDLGTLLHNAVVWLNPAADVVPWLSEDPVAGGVVGGECTTVTVTFNSAGMASGTYYASLLLESNDPDMPAISLPVTMTVDPLPVASFDYAPNAGYFPLTVYFTDTSSNAISPTWDFGDTGTGAGANVNHTYTAAGTYTVTLTVQSAYGCGSATAIGQVLVVNPGAPLAGFDSSTPDCLGDTTYFTNTTVSTGTTTYEWAFGDGGTSTDENPTHVYTASGTYSVALTATNAAGSTAISHDVVIDEAVSGADIAFNPANPTITTTVYFSGSVAAGTEPITWEWAFGDGITATGQYVSHVFAVSDTYTVVLTATNTCGVSTFSVGVVVIELPPQPTEFFIYLPIVYRP